MKRIWMHCSDTKREEWRRSREKVCVVKADTVIGRVCVVQWSWSRVSALMSLTGIERGFSLQIHSRHAGHGGRKFNKHKRKGQRSDVHVQGEREQLSEGQHTCRSDAFHCRRLELLQSE